MSDRCIWCGGRAANQDVEHIIPEAIGCPPGFTLPGTVVCKRCNNGLAHLDRALADEFDLSAFLAGVPRKSGKPPLVSSRGNVLASYVDGEPSISFNMERYAVHAHDGSRLAPFGGSSRNVPITVSVEGVFARVSASVPFGQSPKFVRGLTKVALSSVAYFLGPNVARSSRFDAVRAYVRDGVGTRHALLQRSDDDEYRNTVWAPFKSQQDDFLVPFRLAQVEFLLDLSPGETLLPILEAKRRETGNDGGWCVVPVRG